MQAHTLPPIIVYPRHLVPNFAAPLSSLRSAASLLPPGGNYSGSYLPLAAGQFALSVLMLQAGGLLGEYWDNPQVPCLSAPLPPSPDPRPISLMCPAPSDAGPPRAVTHGRRTQL